VNHEDEPQVSVFQAFFHEGGSKNSFHIRRNLHLQKCPQALKELLRGSLSVATGEAAF